MKITYRIPTEMYAYVEVEAESELDAEPRIIASRYAELSEAFKVKPTNSLPDKEYNQFIDNMMQGDDNHIEQWENMSPEQQRSAQVVKRALKRINYKKRDEV